MLVVTWIHILSSDVDSSDWRCSEYGQDRCDAEAAADAETRKMESLGYRENVRIWVRR